MDQGMSFIFCFTCYSFVYICFVQCIVCFLLSVPVVFNSHPIMFNMKLYRCRQRCIRQNRSISLYHFLSKVWKMADNALTCEDILGNYGNPDHLKLDNILDPPDPDEEEIHIMHPSHYFAIEKLPIHLQTVGNFNILSLNTQSINAKFDAFVALLEIAKQQNIPFHAICLQETWLSENSDLSLLQLNGFTCFSQGKQCSSHGGLITYIDTNINASVINHLSYMGRTICKNIGHGKYLRYYHRQHIPPALWQQLQGK